MIGSSSCDGFMARGGGFTFGLTGGIGLAEGLGGGVEGFEGVTDGFEGVTEGFEGVTGGLLAGEGFVGGGGTGPDGLPGCLALPGFGDLRGGLFGIEPGCVDSGGGTVTISYSGSCLTRLSAVVSRWLYSSPPTKPLVLGAGGGAWPILMCEYSSPLTLGEGSLDVGLWDVVLAERA